MKKTILASIWLLAHIPIINACDICGCSIGNGFSSVLPQIQKNFAGLKYTHAGFKARHIDDGSVSHETSQTLDFWGRYYISKKVQLIWSLPWNDKRRLEPNQTIHTKGIGDLTINLNYTLLNKNQDSLKWKHLWLAGGGIKLPTGNSKVSDNDGLYITSMQPGTGSFDYFLTTMYTVRHNRIGLSSDIQYRINGENKQFYAFGNRLTIGSRLFYWKKIGRNCNIIPILGFSMEKLNKDYQNGYLVAETGGNISSGVLGAELYYKRILLSVYYMRPINQHLSLGYLKADPRLQLNCSLIF